MHGGTCESDNWFGACRQTLRAGAVCASLSWTVLTAMETLESSSVWSRRGDRHAHNNRSANELIYKAEVELQM